jgi:Uma2 family endonuclease
MATTLVKWSVQDYHQMIAVGILAGRSVELLAGDIIAMAPETPLHYNTAKRGTRYLQERLVGLADVRFNGPITLMDSEPELDMAIARLPESRYDTCHPHAEDLFWVVEVAKTSFQKDFNLKAVIYAQAGIPEYWILDLAERKMVILREPSGDRYQQIQTLSSGEVTPLAFPEIIISINQLFA